MAIEKSFCIKGVRDGGGVAFEKRSALETLAFQSTLGISTRARLGAARILRGWNEGNSVLADEGSCAQIRNPYAREPFYDSIVYTAKPSGSADNPELTLKYYVYDPFTTLECRLKLMKSDFKETKDKGGFGITLGCEGTVIAMSIAADHGDTEMKFNCTVSARENDGQTQNDDLGCFKGK